MRIVLGLLVFAVAFGGTWFLVDLGFGGYYNLPALVLTGLGPIGVVVLAYEGAELRRYLALVAAAFRYDEGAARTTLAEALNAVSTSLRAGKSMQSVQAIETAPHEAVRAGGLLLLKRYERTALREMFQTWAQSQLSGVRRAEDFFLTMARAAPAFGLIGTILGFIDLLRHLQDSAALGPGMAMALTATLYGIAASYCIYHPLAKALGAYGRKLGQELRLCEQGLLLIHDGRASHDVNALVA